MRIGISIITQAGHNLWSNGIGQNVYHLATLFQRLPFVEAVYLLNCGDQDDPPAGAGQLGPAFPLIRLSEAADLIDVAVEVSGALDREWVERFRARGGRIVFHNCGQPYVSIVDHTTFGKPGCFSRPDRCDEVWLLDKDAQFSAMMRGIYRCPVHVMPYLWAPNFLLETAVGDGQDFGYRPGALTSAPGVAAIFEPNISPIKMGVIPLMICEEVQRRDAGALARVQMLNAAHMAPHATFSLMIESTDLNKASKITLQARDYFAHVMARGANVVVSHQLECAQNYLYLDALFGGYPLVHNSELFADVGYYYPDSDVQVGAAQILRARREHDRHFDNYKAAADARIARHSPSNRDNQIAYARRLLGLTAANGRRAA